MIDGFGRAAEFAQQRAQLEPRRRRRDVGIGQPQGFERLLEEIDGRVVLVLLARLASRGRPCSRPRWAHVWQMVGCSWP